jgi:hypothetical protein
VRGINIGDREEETERKNRGKVESREDKKCKTSIRIEEMEKKNRGERQRGREE